MRKIRAVIRVIGVVTVTLFVVLFFVIGLLFCFPKTLWRIKLKNKFMSFWAKAVARIIGAEIEINGVRPEPPFLLVSNHLSYIDILPFWGYLKTTFIAKSEIKGWPVIGSIARLLGIIFITRTNKRDLQRVNELLSNHINDAQGVVLFPEGTSTKGENVLSFKSSLLFFPASEQMPVHHASISYKIKSGGPFREWTDICWWGDMDFLPHFWKLMHIKSFKISVNFGDAPIQSSDRKVLAQKLHARIKERFSPTFDPTR